MIWVQGCSLGCSGCFNPETHPLTGGKWVKVEDLFRQIVALGDSIEGITLSGGEPLQQRAAITGLLQRIKTETDLSVILFSGFTWEEISAFHQQKFLNYIDVLIAGRYDASQRLARGLRGSTNKTLHFLTDRYNLDDIQATPVAEVILGTNGEIILSGIDPLMLHV